MARVVVPMRLVLLAIVLLAPRLALASAQAPVIPYDPPPLVHVDGPVTVGAPRVTVDCSVRRILEWSARCRVRASFEIVASAPATLAALGGADVIDLGGVSGRRELAAGERAQVTVTAVRALKTRTTWRDPFVMAPMVARHFLFGGSKQLVRHDGLVEVPLVSGVDVALDGAPALDGDGDGRVVIAARALDHVVDAYRRGGGGGTPGTRERRVTVSMTLPGRPAVDGLLRGGGPLVAAGARDERFLLRLGWEVGVGEHLFASAAIETDFDSVIESLVIDVATPEILLLIPSLRAGVGALARQRGPRDPDFGLRLRAGGNVMSLGTDIDLDYWPAIDDWTVSATVRISF